MVVPHSLSDFISDGIILEGSLVILSKTSIPLDTQDVPLTAQSYTLPNLTLSVLFHIFIYFAILQGMCELSYLTRG